MFDCLLACFEKGRTKNRRQEDEKRGNVQEPHYKIICKLMLYKSHITQPV